MMQLDYRKCEILRNGNYVKKNKSEILKIEDIYESDDKFNIILKEGLLLNNKISRISIDEEILTNLRFFECSDKLKIKGYVLYNVSIFKSSNGKLLWTNFTEQIANAVFDNSNWILITNFEIIKEGMDLEKMKDYEKKGDIFLARYVHNLQNFIIDNPEYGEIDFSYFENRIRK